MAYNTYTQFGIRDAETTQKYIDEYIPSPLSKWAVNDVTSGELRKGVFLISQDN
jgi:hypothetical protein